MAKTTFITKGFDEFASKWAKIEESADAVTKQALFEGAKIAADEVRKAIDTIPYQRFRIFNKVELERGKRFFGISNHQRHDLKVAFGITDMEKVGSKWRVSIGFRGYGSFPTEKYPNGVPNALLARSIESGSSVRKKFPFFRAAIARVEARSKLAMDEKIYTELKKRNDY